MKPNEVKKLKVGDELRFSQESLWKITEIDQTFIYLEGIGKWKNWKWEVFQSPTHMLWKGFEKIVHSKESK